MANSYFNLGVATQPEACKTGTITAGAQVSLVTFGFDAVMVERSTRAFIYAHNSKLMCKWAQDYPRVQPTAEEDHSGYRAHVVEAPPTVTSASGHGIEAGQEREIIGSRQLQLLRIIAATGDTVVTITLES